MRPAGQDLLAGTKAFALKILELCALLPRSEIVRVLGNPILRSGTPVGAHAREGKHSRSRAEMLSKVSVALQELEETRYWLELLGESGIVPISDLQALHREIEELLAILFTSLKTLKRVQ